MRDMKCTRERESERKSEIESERERDNKSMLKKNPSLPNFRNFERHKSSLTAVSTHKLSFGSWTEASIGAGSQSHDFEYGKRFAIERVNQACF